MRRRLFAILLIVITMAACTPKLVEPDNVGRDAPGAPLGVPSPSPTATPTATSMSLPEESRQWLEVSSVGHDAPDAPSEEPSGLEEKPLETEKEPSVATEDVDQDYVETVSVPHGTPTSLGTFVVTAYCDCEKCNGKWTGHKLNTPTQAGLPYPVEGYTISVDPEVIPLGSVVELYGLGARYAQDTGSAIKGKRIDLFFGSHEEALEFGVKKLEVWVYT